MNGEYYRMVAASGVVFRPLVLVKLVCLDPDDDLGIIRFRHEGPDVDAVLAPARQRCFRGKCASWLEITGVSASNCFPGSDCLREVLLRGQSSPLTPQKVTLS